jgi:hypothetical protein
VEGSIIDARLRALGKDRRWLATATGYKLTTIRDCIAPQGKGVSRRMATAIQEALEAEEAKAPVPLNEFTPAERKAIEHEAAAEGFPSPHAWIVAKVRWLLAGIAARPKRSGTE